MGTTKQRDKTCREERCTTKPSPHDGKINISSMNTELPYKSTRNQEMVNNLMFTKALRAFYSSIALEARHTFAHRYPKSNHPGRIYKMYTNLLPPTPPKPPPRLSTSKLHPLLILFLAMHILSGGGMRPRCLCQRRFRLFQLPLHLRKHILIPLVPPRHLLQLRDSAPQIVELVLSSQQRPPIDNGSRCGFSPSPPLPPFPFLGLRKEVVYSDSNVSRALAK